jgi:formimidoylglutamate deiminase
MSAWFACDAWLPQGWARNVRCEVAAQGHIARIDIDANADGCERIDGPVVPGLCDVHSHAFQRAFAGLAERREAHYPDDSFWTWRDLMYRFVARLTPEALGHVTAQLYVELLKGGYTSVCEFHYVHRDPQGAPYADAGEMSERIIAAAGEVGMGLTLLPVLYMTSNFGGAPPHSGQRRFLGDPDGLLRMVQDLRQRHGDAICVGVAPHSLRAVPPDALATLVRGLAAIGGGPVHIHVAEQTKEIDDCLAWSGQRPVQWLIDKRLVTPAWCLIHATHMTPGETLALAQTGAVAGLCPTTEANLGDGFFALTEYVNHGGVYGIGSDSNIATVCAEELRWLEYGQRLLLRQRNVMASAAGPSVGETLYQQALAGGAQASGRPLGGLAVGQRADLVVLDSNHPSLIGRDRGGWLDAYVFCAHGNPVRDVMVGGEWVIRDGRHPLEEAIAQRYAGALQDLTQ